VVRNIANLVPPYAREVCHGVFAALEYAVQVLKVGHIVVLGHARCGGIRAFAEGGPPLSPADSVHKWMSMIAPAAERLGKQELTDDYLTRLEQSSIVTSIENLMTFPYVGEAVRRGALGLHGAYFGVATGEISVVADGEFVKIVADATGGRTAAE
jgi:carbonic anhydrase